MMKNRVRENRAITLIALVVTVIVLLVLAGVSISMLAGQNGVLTRAVESKEKTEISDEKEKIQLAFVNIKLKNNSEAIFKEEFQDEINLSIGNNKANVSSCGNGYDILINDEYYYTIEEDGRITDPKELTKIQFAGDITKNGKYDGETEETAYQIECIEDLIAFSQNCREDYWNSYNGKYIKLIQDLDFKCIYSYNNYQTKQFSEFLTGNANEFLMDSLQTYGFKSIKGKNGKGFKGTFLGNNKEIKGFFHNSGEALFEIISDSKICDLTIRGNGNIKAGIVSNASNSIIRNCINYINCTRAGIVSSASDVTIENCINYGTIYSTSSALGIGGIVGSCTGGNSYINKCANRGNLTNTLRCTGGIVGNYDSEYGELYIYDCINEGQISGEDKTGGIAGASYLKENATLKIERCINKGTIISSDRGPGGIFGDCSAEHNGGNYCNITIKECYNNSKIIGNYSWAGQISGSWHGITNVNFINNFYNSFENIKGVASKDDEEGKINVVSDRYENIEELLEREGIV